MQSLRFIAMLLILTALVVMTSGCLTSQYKEYHFKVNKDGSGSGTIKFVNLLSQEDNGEDVSDADFTELVDNYLNGTSFEDDNPHLTVSDKKLYQLDSMLVGEVTFVFDNLDSIGFYRYVDCKCSPTMFYLGSLSETFVESNGTYLGANRDLPILIWDPKADEFNFKTVVTEDITECHSLLPMYEIWKESH
jgi:hypothetical protein